MLQVISIADAHDPRIAEYQSVARPAQARDAGYFVAEGRLVVERLLRSGRFRVRSVLVNQASLSALTPVLEQHANDVPVFLADADMIERVAGFPIHRGCLAIADRPRAVPVETLIAMRRTLLVVESCGNVDNMGGLFRNAAAFGVDAVILSPDSCDPFYRKAVRTSMAAVLEVPFARAIEWTETLDALKGAGFLLVGTTPRQTAQTVSEFFAQGRPSRVAVLVGSESEGLTALTSARLDVAVRIPTTAKVDSLNLAVAAGIVLSRLSETAVSDTR